MMLVHTELGLKTPGPSPLGLMPGVRKARMNWKENSDARLNPLCSELTLALSMPDLPNPLTQGDW